MSLVEEMKLEGKREGIIEGKREGIIEGKREGIIEGKREGIIEGKRKELLDVLGWTAPDIVSKYEANIKAARTEQELEEIKKMIKTDLDSKK